MCDYHCRFLQCYAGNMSSVHDQCVFRLSELHTYLNDATNFLNNPHLICDAVCTLHEHLLVPYINNIIIIFFLYHFVLIRYLY